MSLQINQNIIMTKKEFEAAIKPEFMTKLKKLRIKTKFLNNIVNPRWRPDSRESEDLNKILNQCLNGNWQNFISLAFVWRNTPEGFDFWHNIQNK